MHLASTVDDMLSDDYKRRFVAEYRQTLTRFISLENMLRSWQNGELGFEPSCSRELLDRQHAAMDAYLSILEERASVEGVSLL